jgi:predicted DCC family thiol-disulfide oxidoreductase YuxK
MRPTLVYDGGCRLCRFAARAVVRLDRARTLSVLPFDDERAGALLEQVAARDRFSSWHLLHPDGARASRGDGVTELLALLPATRRLVPVLRVLPLEKLYALVSRNRGRLGRFVPDGVAPRRD